MHTLRARLIRRLAWRAASDVVAARRPFNNTSTFAAAAGPRRVFYLLTTPAPRRRARTPRRRRGARARTPRAPSRTASSHTAGPRSEASAKAKSRNCPRHRRDDRVALGAPLLGRRTRARTRAGPNNASTRWRQKQAATHKKLWNTITRRLHDKITSSSPRPADRKSAEPRTTAWSRHGADYPKHRVPRVCRRKSREILEIGADALGEPASSPSIIVDEISCARTAAPRVSARGQAAASGPGEPFFSRHSDGVCWPGLLRARVLAFSMVLTGTA